MSVRRGVVAGLVGLALLGGSACSNVGEKIAEEAVERNSNCQNVDIDASEGGFSGECDGEDLDFNATGNATLPDAWPADLAPPQGINISAATDTAGPPRILNVVGGIDGDATVIYQGVKDQLAAAGYTIDSDVVDPAGGEGGTVTATGPEYIANVVVTTIAAEAVDGNVTITYTLTQV